MQFKRKTAVRQRRNILGKKIRGRLSLFDVIAMEHAGIEREEILDLLDRGWLLPMAGGTTPQNQTLAPASYFPKAIVVSTDQTIKQNDMVWWDSVNFTLKPLTAPTQVAVVAGTGGFCGCAAGTNVPGVYPNPAAGSPSSNLPGIVVQRGGTVGLTLQANDVVDGPFTALTQAGDAQTVTRGGATSANRVGFAIVPPPVTPRGTPGATPVGETVAGGTRIEVWLEAKFPITSLGSI